MKTVTYLTRQYGEFAYTPRSIEEVYDPVKHKDIDFEEDAGCIANNDFWMHVPKARFAIEEISIPEWMHDDEYDSLTWCQYTRIGGSEELGKNVYEKLFPLVYENERLVSACLILLNTKNFRSPFRKSLRHQVDEWLAGESQYKYPLTSRQLDKIVYKRNRF